VSADGAQLTLGGEHLAAHRMNGSVMVLVREVRQPTKVERASMNGSRSLGLMVLIFAERFDRLVQGRQGLENRRALISR